MGANAQTSVPAFTAGQVLTAAQMTQVNTGIPVFASSTERDAAFGGAGEKTLAEGQMAYLEDTNATQYYDGSSWAAVAGGKILQVLSTSKLDGFSTTSTSLVDITGLSVSITPSSSSNKVLVIANSNLAHGSSSGEVLQLVRDSTALCVSTAGSSLNGTFSSNIYNAANNQSEPIAFSFLDSPATTSATTYKLQTRTSGGTVYVNRNTGSTYASTSTITVMEVSA